MGGDLTTNKVQGLAVYRSLNWNHFIKSVYIRVDLWTHKRVVAVDISWHPFPLFGHSRLNSILINKLGVKHPLTSPNIQQLI